MSIYKSPKTGQYWQYDFQQKGRRFYGSTGQTTRRRAEQVEADLKLRAKLGTLGAVDDLTLDEAAARWWAEVGCHLAQAPALERELDRTIRLVGPNLLLSEITTERLARAVEKRRGQKTRRGGLPAARTVNKEIISNVRRILRRAAEVWEVPGLRPIHWKKLRLKEPKPAIRDLTPADLAAAREHLPLHWRDFFDVLGRYGPRLSEMFFPLSAIDLDAGRVTLRERKGDDDHQLPLLAADLAMLSARVGRARAAQLDTPWFRELKGGRLKPLTYNAALSAIHRALDAAGLKASKGARVHDLRHHAGTQILRASKNLKVAQRLLGHASIQSTVRYAHALEDDVRGGLEAVEAALQARLDPEPRDLQTPSEAIRRA